LRGISGGDDIYLQEELKKSVYNSLRRAIAKDNDVKALRKNGKDALLSLLWERTKQRPMAVSNILVI
jgi:ribonuclease J